MPSRTFRTARSLPCSTRDGEGCDRVVKVGSRTPLRPAILQTRAHSGAVTGCTDNREHLTNAMSSSFGSAFTDASVHGLLNRLHRPSRRPRLHAAKRVHSAPPPPTARLGLGCRSNHATCGET